MFTSQTIDNYIKSDTKLEFYPKNDSDVEKFWKCTGVKDLDAILSVCGLSDDFNINIMRNTFTINIEWELNNESIVVNYIPIKGYGLCPAISLEYNNITDVGDTCYFVLKWELDRVNLSDKLLDILRRFIKCIFEILDEDKLVEATKTDKK